MLKKPKPANYGVLPSDGYVRISVLKEIVPLSESSIWRHVRLGTFPRPVKIASRSTAWRVEDVRNWMSQRDHSGQEAA